MKKKAVDLESLFPKIDGTADRNKQSCSGKCHNLNVCFSVETEDPEDAVVSAVVKGTDSQHDLAVIAVNLEDIPEEVLNQIEIAELGSSEECPVGEPAVAVGNALGYGQSVTLGIMRF